MEDGRKKATFQHIMLYYFKKAKNATEAQKKICAVYGEGAVNDWMCQKWFATKKTSLRSFVLEISRWTMLHGQVEQLKLIVIK